MVLNAFDLLHSLRKIFAVFCLLAPLLAGAQKLKTAGYDSVSKGWRIESFPVVLKSTADTKMEVELRSVGNDFLLQINGAGIGANTVNVGDYIIFLLDNDSTVTVKAAAVQGFEKTKPLSTYRHEYLLTAADIEMLSDRNLTALRKYSVEGYDDIYFEAGKGAQFKELSAAFLEALKDGNVLKPKGASRPPAFPGGNDVLLSFLNRNLKAKPPMQRGENKKAVVQFMVNADGSVNELQITQSAGAAFDNELLRILRRMPRWKPSMQNGKETNAVVTQTVNFSDVNGALKIQF